MSLKDAMVVDVKLTAGELARSYAIYVAALVAGVSFCLPAWLDWGGPAVIAWKGAGVGLLALWAASLARLRDGWWIAGVLACGAFGDVLLDAVSLTAGAAAFLVGHVFATILYNRHGARALATIAGAITIAFAAWLMTHDIIVAIYGSALGTMAASAIYSTFPRRVGVGAALFALSDLLIFTRLGPLAGSDLPRLLVWPTYFAGQALIAHGVVSAFRKEQRQ